MRKLLGWVVLLGGVGALGYAAPKTHMAGIQETLTEDARQFADIQVHPLEVFVSGRDLVVSGTVTDVIDYATILAGFEQLDGIRVVDFAQVATLPMASPYEARIQHGVEGIMTIVGVAPSEVSLNTLQDTLGYDVGLNMTLAAGAPDDMWGRVLAQLATSVTDMRRAVVVVSDTTITLDALAPTPLERAALLDALDKLPEGYTVDAEIDFEDDGTPLRLRLSMQAGEVTGTGKVPADMPDGVMDGAFPFRHDTDIAQSVRPAADPVWPEAAIAAMTALSPLIDGQLNMLGTGITLTGAGSPDGIAAAQAALDTLPDGYDVTTDLSLWDDGTPLQMSMDWDGTRATAIGKLPAGFTPRAPAELAVVDDARRSFLSDEAGNFTRNADAGAAALGALSAGLVTVTQTSITLTGTATSPQVDGVLDGLFEPLAPTTDITRDITYLDDGSPAAWILDYTASDGATLRGRLPNGLGVQDMSDALGVEITGDPATALTDTDTTAEGDTLTIAATYLPELEALSLSRDEDGTTLDLTISPGVNLDLVAIDLAERLPADVSFSISTLDTLPDDGTTRRNAATGLSEVFRRGFWLPDLDFTADPDGCTQQADALLERAKITFLSGSAQLDATSIRAINGLAAVAQICAQADLVLEIGGHTDATGSEDDNQDLSFARASAVLDALAQRGPARTSMSAAGYGSSRPIADNDTDDGRAANRRTTLIFNDPLTP